MSITPAGGPPGVDPAADPLAAWTHVLDRIEAGLEQPHLPGDLPTGAELGTMPASLRPRAERLLAAHRRLEAELVAQRDEVARELRTLRGPRTRPGSGPSVTSPGGVDELA